MEALLSRISNICRLFGFRVIRVRKPVKQPPKKSKFERVAVYDNDWDD